MIAIKGGIELTANRIFCSCLCHERPDEIAEVFGEEGGGCGCGCPPIILEMCAEGAWREVP